MGASMITVLMGAPGAGKSTWVKANKTDKDYIYNTEGVRIDRDMDVATYMHNQRRKAIKAVENGLHLIADGTHTIKSHRLVWINLAKRLQLPTRIIVFNTQLATLQAVQKGREYPAPSKVVSSHSFRMRQAMKEIKSEGWGHIEIITR
jgi:hypothetical protein